MCPISKTKGNKAKLMKNDLFEKIIVEISKNHLPFTYVYLFLQNEPLLDKDIFRKLRMIKKISNGRLKTGIATNGTLFTNEKIKELLESEVDELIFSIDALTEDTYKKIRQGLDFNKVMRNINNVIDSGYDKYLAVKFVIQKDNILELQDFIKFWKEKHVTVQLSPLNNRSGDLDVYNELIVNRTINSSLPKFMHKARNVLFEKITHAGCPVPITAFNILYNGDVILCCDDFSNKMIVGNVNESSIKEIWHSKKYDSLRDLLFREGNKKISVCQGCSKMEK
jgi:radical SAM protein with 4Fe4S-binding SPASM domain